uniref:Thioredoxin domain-containing protein n=2 Tax=viral metagenome TaxID=1070528 RepID=A0A6C0I0N9_9ZZZZ
MITVGKIYNNGCGHCTSMAHDWEKMKDMVGEVKIVEFETTKNKKELEKFEKDNPALKYSGVPTIFKIGGNGKIEYYNGERKAEQMANWVLGKSVKGGKKTKNAKRSKKRKTKKNCGWFW